jgi:hypothetical protein
MTSRFFTTIRLGKTPIITFINVILLNDSNRKEGHHAISLCADGRGRRARRFFALSILSVTSFISTAFHEYYS